jgi:hypothetical protein
MAAAIAIAAVPPAAATIAVVPPAAIARGARPVAFHLLIERILGILQSF